jgi:RNA polymerase sigma-70 factor (ECF subfamily)
MNYWGCKKTKIGISLKLMENHTDEQLIRLAAKKNNGALEALVARYIKVIYRFVYKYAQNQADAEDITQEVFIKVWKNLNKFNHTKKFRPWLYEIAKNTSLDFLKKKKPIPFSRLTLTTDNSLEQLNNIKNNTVESPAVMVEQSFLANKLSSVIKMLSPKYAEIISLYHEQELNFREIAKIKHESINTVKSRYRRALLLVKKIILEAGVEI